MRIIKGYPLEINIDGVKVTIHDVNRLILSLYEDMHITPKEKDELKEIYLQERQAYLDKIYHMTEEKKALFLELEKRLSEEIEDCRARLERMKIREEEKKNSGEAYATNIEYHLQIANIRRNFDFSEADDIQDALFEEDKFNPFWGFRYERTTCGEDEEDNSYNYSSKPAETKADENLYNINHLKEKYIVAWEDIEKIKDLMLTIKFIYSRE